MNLIQQITLTYLMSFFTYLCIEPFQLGRNIVADPAICHGEPTFRGTRILVADVLEQVASGMAWEAIIEEWRGALTKEAIAEAIRLAVHRT